MNISFKSNPQKKKKKINYKQNDSIIVSTYFCYYIFQ